MMFDLQCCQKNQEFLNFPKLINYQLFQLNDLLIDYILIPKISSNENYRSKN